MMIIIIIIMTIVVNRDQSWILTGKTTWSGALVFPGQTDRRTGGRTDGRTDKKMVRLPVCLRQTGKLYSNKNKTKKVKKSCRIQREKQSLHLLQKRERTLIKVQSLKKLKAISGVCSYKLGYMTQCFLWVKQRDLQTAGSGCPGGGGGGVISLAQCFSPAPACIRWSSTRQSYDCHMTRTGMWHVKTIVLSVVEATA